MRLDRVDHVVQHGVDDRSQLLAPARRVREDPAADRGEVAAEQLVARGPEAKRARRRQELGAEHVHPDRPVREFDVPAEGEAQLVGHEQDPPLRVDHPAPVPRALKARGDLGERGVLGECVGRLAGHRRGPYPPRKRSDERAQQRGGRRGAQHDDEERGPPPDEQRRDRHRRHARVDHEAAGAVERLHEDERGEHRDGDQAEDLRDVLRDVASAPTITGPIALSAYAATPSAMIAAQLTRRPSPRGA